MSNVIQFPVKTKEEFWLDDSELVNTEYAYINDDLVKKPMNGRQYLELCKVYLTKEEYESVLCGVMDVDYYNDIPKHLRDIVNAYFSFPEL